MILYVLDSQAQSEFPAIKATKEQIEQNEIVQELILHARYDEYCTWWYEYICTKDSEPLSFEEWNE